MAIKTNDNQIIHLEVVADIEGVAEEDVVPEVHTHGDVIHGVQCGHVT